MTKMQENTDRGLGRSSDEIINDCMVLSALESTQLALDTGLTTNQIIISCKVSRPAHLIEIYRQLARQTKQPLHLGLTEAGMGTRGLVWSASSMGILLSEGIGDTIRVSLTPKPGGDRRDEVLAACELLQAMGLRSFAPSVTACPGCGRTTSSTFQELAERIQDYVRGRMPEWKTRYEGVEEMTVAVMGCVVNGPGESKAANIGISLPGTGEAPSALCISTVVMSRACEARTRNWPKPFGRWSTTTSRQSTSRGQRGDAPALAERFSATMPIRLIAVDIDGTLLDSRGKLPAVNRQAVHDALGAGVVVTLVTGRTYHHAQPVATAAGTPRRRPDTHRQ